MKTVRSELVSKAGNSLLAGNLQGISPSSGESANHRSLPISRASGHRDGPRRVADALCLTALMPLRETGAVSANLKAGVRRG